MDCNTLTRHIQLRFILTQTHNPAIKDTQAAAMTVTPDVDAMFSD